MHTQNGIYRNKITFGNKINLGNTLSGSGVPTGWEYMAAFSKSQEAFLEGSGTEKFTHKGLICRSTLQEVRWKFPLCSN